MATAANLSADNLGLQSPESTASTVGTNATANTDNTSASTAATSDASGPSSDDKAQPADAKPAAVDEDRDERKEDNDEDPTAEEHAKGSTAKQEEPTEPDADAVVARLTELARNFRWAKYQNNLTFDGDEKADFLVKTIQSLQWILQTITEVRHPVQEDDEVVARTKANPELQRVSWEEWQQYSRAGPSQPHASLYILIDEPPSVAARFIRMRGDTEASSLHADLAIQMKQRQGVKPLPARVRIASVAARRILDTLCNGKLRYSTNGLVLLRPYRLLVHLDEEIRKRRDELRKACQVPITKGDNGSKSDDKAANAESHSSIAIFASGTDWDKLTLEERVEAADDFDTVVSFIDQYLKPMAQLRAVGESVVYFNELWHVLNPGSLVYVKDRTIPQKVWRVLQGIGGRKPLSVPDTADQLQMGAYWQGKALPFQLDCYYVDFNGSSFVRVFRTFSIDEFTDLRQIKSLPIVPFHVAKELGLVDPAELLERGADFVKCTQPSYNYYRGRSLCYSPRGELLRRPERGSNGNSIAVLSEAIEGPVMVDFERCLQAIPDWLPEKANPELSKTSESEIKGDPTDDYIEDDRVWDVRLAETILNFKDPGQRLEKHGPPTKDDMLLLPDRIFAFVLRTRRWACLQLGYDDSDPPQKKLQPVKENLDAWKDLQIHGEHRSIIESLMKTHFGKAKSQRRQYDLIQDKGKGLIILLHGVPGVGKTSTAETVAEYYNKPLLPITCGDLGLTPTAVEANLQTSFQMAQAWECVLLLDEADVFLAERSRDNVERNALVSVFLRVLEYYEGILFLTTNKVGAFDEAFKSRVSMALYYPALNDAQTTAIWRTQMRRIRKSSMEAAPGDKFQHIEFEEEEIMMYAAQLWMLQQTAPQFKPVWNGRQIRNAFQTAIALAEYHRKEGEYICVRRWHFERVAAVSNEFNAYLWRVKHRRDESERALKDEFRYDKQGIANYGLGTAAVVPGEVGGGAPGTGAQSFEQQWGPAPVQDPASLLGQLQASQSAAANMGPANPGANFGTNTLGANLGVNTLAANMGANLGNLGGMPSTLAHSGGVPGGGVPRGVLGGAAAPGTQPNAADYGQGGAFNYGGQGYQGQGRAGTIAGMGGGLPQNLQGLRPEQMQYPQQNYPQIPASQQPQGSSMPPGAPKYYQPGSRAP